MRPAAAMLLQTKVILFHGFFNLITGKRTHFQQTLSRSYGVHIQDNEDGMTQAITPTGEEIWNNFMTGMAKREGCEEIMRGKLLDSSLKGFFVTPSIHYWKNPNWKPRKAVVRMPSIPFRQQREMRATASASQSKSHNLPRLYLLPNKPH